MLLSETKQPFNSEDYIYEIKFDGMRALIFTSPKTFIIQNRHGKDITRKYPELKKIQKLVSNPTIFDGEIVSFEKGLPNFYKLQERTHLKSQQKIKYMAIHSPVIFVAFDILYNQKDLTNLTLLKRKEILNQIPNTDELIKSMYIEEKGIELYKKIQKLGLEGIVAKEKNSIYEINRRSINWIKIKNLQKEQFIIGGYTEKENTPFFSILIGEYKKERLYYVGRVSVAKKENIYLKIKNTKKRKSSPFINKKEVDITYINPIYTCDIEYVERSKDNRLRQPVYRGSSEEICKF